MLSFSALFSKALLMFFLCCFALTKSIKAQDIIEVKLPPLTSAQKLHYIQVYAPIIYMHSKENFFPSSVEFAFEHLIRYQDKHGNYCVKSKLGLRKPSSIVNYFKGDLESSKIYAFWVDKRDGIKEISYFIYYPYNRGKKVLKTLWGNHEGDWEHGTIRFKWKEVDGNLQLLPYEVYLSAHHFGTTAKWEEVEKENGHPVFYSAKGSHGMYFHEGKYIYQRLVIGKLVDECNKGLKLNGANSNTIVAFDFRAKKGLKNNAWPNWMRKDFATAGENPENPSENPIYRWGTTKERGKAIFLNFYRLSAGPTGPISKALVWDYNNFEK